MGLQTNWVLMTWMQQDAFRLGMHSILYACQTTSWGDQIVTLLNWVLEGINIWSFHDCTVNQKAV